LFLVHLKPSFEDIKVLVLPSGKPSFEDLKCYTQDSKSSLVTVLHSKIFLKIDDHP
jgi:hypothetical protein